jgi:hypothetical protein
MQPREPADEEPAPTALDTQSLEGLDSISRAALIMMQNYFRVMDSAMQYDPALPDCLKVPVIDLDETEITLEDREKGTALAPEWDE